MQQEIGAEVQLHAQDVAATWQRCLQFIVGPQLCQQIGLEEPIPVRVYPSKRSFPDLNEMEFKVDIRRVDAEKIGLLPLLQGQFRAYSVEEYDRVRVKGCKGIINLHRTFTEKLRADHPQWADQFKWPRGAYVT